MAFQRDVFITPTLYTVVVVAKGERGRKREGTGRNTQPQADSAKPVKTIKRVSHEERERELLYYTKTEMRNSHPCTKTAKSRRDFISEKKYGSTVCSIYNGANIVENAGISRIVRSCRIARHNWPIVIMIMTFCRIFYGIFGVAYCIKVCFVSCLTIAYLHLCNTLQFFTFIHSAANSNILKY